MSPERKAVIVAASTAVFLTILKFVTGIFTGSMAIITSAADSALDFVVSLMNYFAVRTSEREADETHNYGHGKVEWLGALFESLVIMVSGGFIISLSIHKILYHAAFESVNQSLFIMIVAVSITAVLVVYLRRIARETGSLILAADTLHYQSDLYTNIGIIAAFLLIKIFNIPLLDPIVSIIVAIYIMFWAVEIFRKGLDMLMDRSFHSTDVWVIQSLIMKHVEVASFHFLKTRFSGKYRFIEFHIVFRDVDILLRDAHRISDEIEIEIIELFPQASITIHLDFFDDSQPLENQTPCNHHQS